MLVGQAMVKPNAMVTPPEQFLDQGARNKKLFSFMMSVVFGRRGYGLVLGFVLIWLRHTHQLIQDQRLHPNARSEREHETKMVPKLFKIHPSWSQEAAK